MIDTITLIVFLTGVLIFMYFALKLEIKRQKKFMRLYDEMYIYFKNINKGE